MIERMKFLSITGPKGDIDRVVDTYLSRYEIHLENALSELKTVSNLRPYIESNPYREEFLTARGLAETYKELLPEGPGKKMPVEQAAQTVREIDGSLKALIKERGELEEKRERLKEAMDRVAPFGGLDFKLRELFGFKYIKFRFGRISREYYEKLTAYVYDTIEAIQFKCSETKDYIWLVYCVPEKLEDKIDAIYASMHFERMFLPKGCEGTPEETGQRLEDKIKELDGEIARAREEAERLFKDRGREFLGAYRRLETFATNFDVRKLAACTKHDDHTFFILCGWMTEGEARQLQQEIEHDENAFCIIEDDHSNIMSRPPTKMKNPGLFKPFEMYVEMYGLPSYNEIDPTILVGLTYSILFGFMFGDVGQGLCLLIGGFLLYRLKKVRLAGIISCCGAFSVLFGFLFGSVFGFEDVIDAVWLRPQLAMTDLPFIGRLNTVFVVAVAIGMGIILLCMALNIINSVKARDTEKTWFDTNGAAGLVFYLALSAVVVLYMSGSVLPATAVLAVMFLLPLLIMFFKEPLTAIALKRTERIQGSKGMFVTQGIFELFEVLLSYFSNTLSFVRVGAFAVSHAAMMEVVLMLAGAESGDPNWAVVVGGNLFVCGMEGLIVGIQVLRLEYYELFSRFYRGSGRAFKPYGGTAQGQ